MSFDRKATPFDRGRVPSRGVSAHSRREKNIRHGHISTLHIWWARRPLAACRAFIYASLVDDPDADQERDELLKEVADLANWDAVRNPERVVRPRAQGGSGLTGAQLLDRARQRILDCNDGKPPRLLDPFAGGGAIPLEALRLGCEVEASDLNPVAVLILKGTVEYPQKYGRPDSRPVPGYIKEAALKARSGQKSFADGDLVAAYRKNPLATDVRYWGNWMLEQAWSELSEFYPPDPDGSLPAAYLWSRTVPCPNCRAEMPLIRQYWLARKDDKTIALQPVLDRPKNRVTFTIVNGAQVGGDPAAATATLGDTVCLLCRQVMKGPDVRRAARSGGMTALLTAVVLDSDGRSGKRYRVPGLGDQNSFERAASRLAQVAEQRSGEEVAFIPDEPMPIRAETTGGVVSAFGLDTYGKLFSARQLLAMTTFVGLVGSARERIVAAGLDDEYANTVSLYLALAVDRLADRASTLCRWDNTGESIMGTFGRQGLPMVWDYAEVNPFSGMTGDFHGALEWICTFLDGSFTVPASSRATVSMRDARHPSTTPASIILTDPPYYDAINYSNLSDFFYVWLKRSVGHVFPHLLELPLTPKRDQIVMSVFAGNGAADDESPHKAARRQYVDGMARAFQAMAAALEPGGLAGVVFAHTDPDAWGTLIEGLLDAELIPTASWPIDTEMGNRVAGQGQARLATSVWMACRPREVDAGEAFIGDVIAEMRNSIRNRLLAFWSAGIRGADFFISAIGPALSVYGRHSRVMRPDGTEVTVRDFLDLVRREATQVALEQVLHGADLGIVDPVTRQYVTWVWGYSRTPLDAGEAIALCLATGADYGQVVRSGSIAVEVREKSKKLVKLRTIRERGRDDEHLGLDSPARPAPLIDELQRAANLWGLNRMDELGTYRAGMGETRWVALRTLGQAVAECLPDGDEDRRLIFGLLGSNVMARAATNGPRSQPGAAQATLPGLD